MSCLEADQLLARLAQRGLEQAHGWLQKQQRQSPNGADTADVDMLDSASPSSASPASRAPLIPGVNKHTREVLQEIGRAQAAVLAATQVSHFFA